jgi:hypothetical protein
VRTLAPLNVAITVAVLVSIPMFAALIVLLGGARWFPCGDMAQAELHMRGFLSHPPLVGAAGRIVDNTGFQGSHPGPSLWVAMYPVYALGGRTSAALMASVVSVHLVSIVAAVWLVVRRWGRWAGVISGLSILLLLRSSGSDFMVEPWNVWMAFLPFLVMMLLLFDVVAPRSDMGQRTRVWRWVIAVAVGSHCVQCHAGYLVIVVAALLLALGVLIADTRSVKGAWRAPFLGGAVATLIMWSAPIVDQMRRVPGNLTILREHFTSPEEPYVALSLAARIVTSQYNVVGPWVLGPHVHASNDSWLRWPGFILMVGMTVWAIRRSRGTVERRLLVLTNVVTGVGVLSITRIFGPYYEYTIRWFWVLVVLNVVLCSRVIVRGRSMTAMSPRRVVAFVSLASVTLVGLTTFQAVEGLRLPGATDSRIVSILAPQLREELDPADRYLIRMYDPYTLNATGFGTLLELGRSGYEVGVDLYFAAAALPHRVVMEDDVDAVLWVVVGQPIERARQDPNLVEIASADPRSSSEQARAVELLAAIRAGLERTGRDDLVASLERPGASLVFAEPPLEVDVADDVRALIRLGQPVSVFRAEPGANVTAFDE